jgi:AcrR family transcriptional regulator
MDEIARDLQMSKKTIYKHFPSKNELLEAVCDMRIDTVQTKMNDIVDSNDDSVTKFIKILNMNKSMMMNCSQSWLRDLQVHAPHCKKKFDEMRNSKIIYILTRLLEQGKKEKLVEHIPSQIIITAFLGAVESVTNTDFILNNKFSFHEAMIVTAEIFFNGFLTVSGKEKYTNTKKLFENVLSS